MLKKVLQTDGACLQEVGAADCKPRKFGTLSKMYRVLLLIKIVLRSSCFFYFTEDFKSHCFVRFFVWMAIIF